jgi:SHS2 domain-containing protein
MKGFEEIDHTSDRAFRVTGPDLVSLLENAAHAMRELEGPRTAGTPSATRQIEVQGADRESLLVNWLNEILYLEQVHRLVCEGVHIDEVKNDRLCARVETRERERSETHIKAVTFHNLKIRETAGGLEAEVVVDV